MRSLFLWFALCRFLAMYVRLVSFALGDITCNAGETYFKFVKYSGMYANEETFRIYDGNVLLYTSPTLVSSEPRTIEECLTSSTNNQYSLQLIDAYGDSWSSPAYLEIVGEYGNVFFKATMTDKELDEFPLSMNYAIAQGATWKMTSGSITDGWTAYSFSDSDWSDATLGSVTVTASGTQYFRKQFVGLANMAAYDVRLKYKDGVIAYINGAEVYRDNMPGGVVTSTTAATGSYPSLDYHGFVRPGSEVNSQQSILAVEVHFQNAQTSVDFNAYLALLTTSVPGSECYIYGGETTITSTVGSNPQYIFDFGTWTSYFASATDLPATISIVFNGPKPFINGVRVYPYSYTAEAPNNFIMQGSNDNQVWTNVVTVANAVYSNSAFQVFNGYFFASLYNNYRLTISSSLASTLHAYEMQPLICSSSIPTSITYTPNTFTFWAVYEEVNIRPDVTEFTNCTSTALPQGLTLDATTCVVSGVVTTDVPVTTVTVTSNMNGNTYTGSFSFSFQVCSGTVLNVLRTYKNNALYESFEIKDATTQEVALSVTANSGQVSNQDWNSILCVSGTKYTVSVSSTMSYWQAYSHLYVRSLLSGEQMETILRMRYDTYVGFATSRTFNVQYAIGVHSNWYYKFGEVPGDWHTSDSTSGWTEGNDSSYPTSSNQIQLYKKTFTVSDINNIAGFVLSLRFKYGCIVYLNGREAYRKGITDPAISTSSYADNIYTEVMYRQVSLPIKAVQIGDTPEANYIQQGSNTIAIGLVAVNPTQTEAVFDCALRMMAEESESRVFDYTVSYNAMYGFPSAVFDHYYGYDTYYSYCSSNYVSLTFSNDRHEWINSITITLFYTQDSQQPRQFVVKARNGSDDWTTLTTVTDLTWSQVGQAKTFFFQNNNAYNEYRFEDFSTGDSTNCYWRFNSLDLTAMYTTMIIPELTYTSTVLYRNIEMAEMYPNSEFYYDFQITPELPAGITLDRNTGMISGMATAELPSTSYSITAKKLTGGTSTATFTLAVEVCTGGRSLITLVAHPDDYPEEGSYKVYQGVGTSGTVVASIDAFPVANGLNYGDFCLNDGIYTLQLTDSFGDGWASPSGYYMTVDLGTMIFEMGQMPSGVDSISTMFSSYLPFQIEYTDWRVSFDTLPDWNAVNFDDSAWSLSKANAIGVNEKITTYIRKEVTIPDINSYYVLNIRMKYTGGVAAYFNGKLVARFNLQENFNENSESITSLDSPMWSKFHIILATVQAVSGKNMMAFEIHRPVGQSSSNAVVFDATGVFGVNDCSIVVDSVTEATSSYVYEGSELEMVSLSPLGTGYLDNAVGSFFAWTVENLHGTRFNSFAMQNPFARTGLGFSLYVRNENTEDYTSALALLDQSLAEKARNRWSVPLGIAGFKQLRYVVDAPASSLVYISSFVLEYCKPTGSGVCPGIDDYPSVGEGEISPAGCEQYYSGYSYRVCTNGQLGEIQMDKCKQKIPKNMAYSYYMFTLVVGTVVKIDPPTYENIIERFYLAEGQTLPAGLVLDEKTGGISGVPTEAKQMYGYTIYGENQSGAASITINIVVNVGKCQAVDKFPETVVGETAVYECSNDGSYFGSLKKTCVLGEKDGEWEDTKGFCMPQYVLYIIIAVVVVVIVIVIIVLVSKKSKSKNPKKASGSVKPSSSKKTLSKQTSAKTTTAVKV